MKILINKYTGEILFYIFYSSFITNRKQENLQDKKSCRSVNTSKINKKYKTDEDVQFVVAPDYAFSAAASSSPPLVLRV